MSEITTRYRHLWETPEEDLNASDRWFLSKEDATKDREELVERAATTDEDYSDYFDASWPHKIEAVAFPAVDPPDGQAIVLLDEEYGYRTWVWYTEMSDEGLKMYWEGLKTVSDFFFNPRMLPGTLIPWWPDSGNPEEGVFTFDPKGFGWDGDEPEGTVVWLRHQKILWKGHIHQDDDSGIGHPDIGGLRHAGFEEDGE
jgi:hypothetical protein